MIYTPLTKRAAEIAYNAHMGQRDKAGMPYIFHPYHVAEQMKDEMTVCAALLHDVAEDTAVTLEDLKHNSDISRMSKDSPLYERALALRKKYAAALALLEE